jgi:hypothetical protein
MPMQVSGYLAEDGTFFEREPECKRYEAMGKLSKLCESHNTDFEYFLRLLTLWHLTIQEYYDANKDCEKPQESAPYNTEFNDAAEGHPDDIPAFLHTKGDQPYTPIGDKDAPGFLELALGKHQ